MFIKLVMSVASLPKFPFIIDLLYLPVCQYV